MQSKVYIISTALHKTVGEAIVSLSDHHSYPEFILLNTDIYVVASGNFGKFFS